MGKRERYNAFSFTVLGSTLFYSLTMLHTVAITVYILATNPKPNTLPYKDMLLINITHLNV